MYGSYSKETAEHGDHFACSFAMPCYRVEWRWRIGGRKLQCVTHLLRYAAHPQLLAHTDFANEDWGDVRVVLVAGIGA